MIGDKLDEFAFIRTFSRHKAGDDKETKRK